MQYHPDRNKAADANQRFREIQNAYDVLMDYAARTQYDQMLSAAYSQRTSSTSSGSTAAPDTRFDPYTGKRNKYYRGKQKEERDLNAPFDNFVKQTIEDFEPDFDSLTRIFILGIPGILLSFFVSAILNGLSDVIDIGDVLVAVPFLTFHFFVAFDCLLPSTMHYALLTKVHVDSNSQWKELFVRVTDGSSNSHIYHKITNKEWYKDRMYVHQSSINFSEVQQFVIYKSALFKMKMEVNGIVGETIKDLSINKYRKTTLLLFSVIQIVMLSFFITLQLSHFFVFAFVFGIQAFYIYKAVISNTLSERDHLNYLIHWFK